MDTPAPASPSLPTPEPAPARRPSLSLWRALQTVVSVGILTATLFTMWTPANLFTSSLTQKMSLALIPNQTLEAPLATPTGLPNPRIGIVAGHWGNDSGAVCADGLSEADVNLKVATLVKQSLLNEGFEVDLLEEFDKRLTQYQALVLVSIHNDSCDYINDEATGFKVAAALASPYPEKSEKLTACLVDRYQKITGMVFHFNSITPDMTQYHAYNEIHTDTTAAVIETGFLNLDRQILTEHPDVVAHGISAGILCYIHNEEVASTPTPSQP